MTIVLGYFASIYIMFNRVETYYGKVNKSKILLYSKEERHITSLSKLSKWKTYKNGDILKVQYTDQKGVILNIHTVKGNEVPNDIMKKIKQ
ncbi:hypothetical protein [Staphylococcus gallinarum]|uniref:hypothetical protein n=2 Tax=Staphylococcus gallinarum TaxID=1293 RepID=UPI000E68E1E5|nr:hypothetical protein [Staphylococcus gallinarum]RIO76043.1 hypothetical protein BUZ07_13770 [Staphylococcus gallinarum]